ncbi:MAG: hypothetical protein NVS9B4_01970 [Candidatus Acidiferrum sp.]
MFPALLTFSAICIAGYHSGIEDDAIYLPAIKKMLNPALYPHDAPFFASQTKVFLLLRIVGESARVMHIPLEWIQLLWQVASVFLLVAGTWYVAARCFHELRDRFAAVALVSALLTMPVAGTSLFIADQHLHPRTLACAAILFATGAVLDRRYKLAIVCSLMALLIHPLMAAFGIVYLILLALPLQRLSPKMVMVFVTLPLPIITRPNAAWREAALTRSYFFLWRWEWYEWLGIFAPMVLLWWFGKIADKTGLPALARLCRRLVLFSVLMSAAGIVVGIPARLDWLAPIQPMRHLQLVYLLMLLAGGGLLAHYILRNRVWRWLLLFIPLCGGMWFAQKESFSTSTHIELPGAPVTNRWVRCFRWIQENTPEDAYFAVDPGYMSRPNEDNFGFRAIAERSKLADYSKDAAVVAVTPDLAPKWKEQVDALRGYENFRREDFLRLKVEFGTDWALVEKEIPGLPCPYRQNNLAVCRIE